MTAECASDDHATWIWAARRGVLGPATSSLSALLLAYRRERGASQSELGDLLGYDRSYVSLLERDKRRVTDTASLRRIADVLGVPHHVLGVTGPGDDEYTAMLQFAGSATRLGELARQTGRAADAVVELWPLVARLGGMLASGWVGRDVASTLVRARTALGIALGHALPEERLIWAARWTGKALRLAERLDDPPLRAYVLRMHGNELRKAGRVAAGTARLWESVLLSETEAERSAASLLLARAAGELGNSALFDSALAAARTVLDRGVRQSMLVTPFALREVQLRGLLGTGRSSHALSMVERRVPHDDSPVAPQWFVIERITTGEILAGAGETGAAVGALDQAVRAASQHRLPRQIQRALRVVQRIDEARTQPLRQYALDHLDRLRYAVAGPYAPVPAAGG